MPIKNVEVPLYDCAGCAGQIKCTTLIVGEYKNRITLTITDIEREIQVECYFDDLQRAWEAVKP